MKPKNFNRLIRNTTGLIFTLVALTRTGAVELKDLSSDDQLVAYLHNASVEDMVTQVRSMTVEDKKRVLETIKNNQSGLWENPHPLVTLFLGDPETRKKAINDFREQRFFTPELVKLGEPWVIEELAFELYREEPFANYIEGDIMNYPLSYGVAGLIIANLQNATIYSDDVLQWAKRTSPHALPQLRAAMRDWWRENAQSFKEHNYKSVKRGREVPLVEKKAAEPPAAAGPVVPEPRRPSSAPLPSTPAAVAVESPTPSAAFLWTGAGVAIALLVGLIVFWKRRV